MVGFGKKLRELQIEEWKGVVVTVSLLWNDDKTRSLFPLCICLTRLDPDDKAKIEALKYQAVQRFTFRGSSEIDENRSTQVEANFLIPKLAMEAKSHQYYLLILASVENPISLSEVNAVLMPWDVASNEYVVAAIDQLLGILIEVQ